LAATATLHVDCPGFSLTPSMVTVAPGGLSATNFQATYADGTSALVNWSVLSLGSPIDIVGFVDASGHYLPPPIVPSPVPFALVVATLAVDPSVGDASVVSIQDQPVSVAITTPSQTVFVTSTTSTFHAQVTNLSPPFDDPSVQWTLTRGTSPQPYRSSDIMLDQNTGVLTVTNVSAVITNAEEDSYVVTATSRQDSTKSDSLKIQIYGDATHVPTPSVQIAPATGPLTLLPAQTQQFTATFQNDPLGASNIQWSLTKIGESTIIPNTRSTTQTWLSDSGVFTAGIVAGTTNETYTVTAIDKTTSTAFASATVTVAGPVGVTISPATAVTVTPGDSLAFSAVVTNVVPSSAHDVTWTLTGVSGTDQSSFDSKYNVFQADPLAAGKAYTLTATSKVDASKFNSVTINVAPDANGLSGTVGYRGASTGQVYVSCAESTNSLLTAGTIAVSTQPSATNAAHFRIRGGSCPAGATVTAWMDTLGTGHFVYGADPSVSVPVPAPAPAPANSRSVNLMLADYQARQPPPTATAPSITQVQWEEGGAVVLFTPYADTTAKLEYAQEYDVYYQLSSTLMTGSTLDATGTKVTVKPGNFGLALLPLASGTYSVGVQAKFVSAGGTVTLSPPSLSSMVTSSVIIPAATNGSIAGSADLSALTSSLGTSSVVHVFAFDPTAPSTLAGASRGTLTTGHTIADFNILGLGAGTFGLQFFVDFDGNGQLDPADLVAALFDPVRYFDNGSPTPGYSLSAGAATALQAAYAVPSRSAEVHVLTDVNSDTAVSTITYSVTSGAKSVVQATHLATDWDTETDLFAVEHLMTPQPFRRNTFSSMSNLGTTLLAPNVMTSFLVQYAGGSSETLTAPVVDQLTKYHPVVSIVKASGGTDYPTTPVFSWNAPNSSDLAASNTLDHFTLVITQGSGSSLTTVRTVTITPATTTSYTWMGTALSINNDYSYQLSAVDAAGDRVWTRGAFHTVGP
jgi:hypothetical protein